MSSEIEELLFELLDIEEKLSQLEKRFKLDEGNGIINKGLTLEYMIKLETIKEQHRKLYDSALDEYVSGEATNYRYN